MKTLYAILAVMFAFVCAYAGGDHMRPPVHVNMLGRIGIFILAALLAYIGALIGDFIRQLAIPDSIITTGGMASILKEKFFWFIVPQLVGCVIGGALGGVIIIKVFF